MKFRKCYNNLVEQSKVKNTLMSQLAFAFLNITYDMSVCTINMN